ncbi:MAG: DUF2490 domain-containing protein [Flavobacteriales bacterium]|nr:DUF2490 domain-containing protein [Flavobacteriales bacterium]
MKLNKFPILIFLLLIMTIRVWSQKRIVDSSLNTWWSNTNKYSVNENWYFSSELHLRRANGLEDWQQFLFRPALNYKLNSSIDLSLGYTYIRSCPYGNQPIAIITPENNIWEQITLKHQSGKLKISHRYRFEQRFIGQTVYDASGLAPTIEGNKYAQRFRYRLTLSRTISKNGKLFSKAFNELWINLDDKSVMPTSLNQNWLYGGLGYKIIPNGSIQLGYMNQVVKKGDGIHFENNHTLQITIGYKFENK